MTADRMAATNGRAPVAERRAGARSELDELRATCRRQASVIDTLGEAISTFRAGTSALKAENADLRAENHQMRERRDTRARGHGAPDEAELAEVGLSSNVQAPAAARAVVTRELRDRVTASVLERAQLLASELTTNSVLHSGAPADAQLILRIEISGSMLRLEVEDAGHDGAIAPRPADGDGGGGFGLNIVQMLSERWGLERVSTEGTRVWAQLALEPLTAPPSSW